MYADRIELRILYSAKDVSQYACSDKQNNQNLYFML